MENERQDKCWGNEVKNILMDVPMTFVSENHGYVTVRRGTNFLSSGGAAALGVRDFFWT